MTRDLILVIDDDEDLGVVLCELIESRGWRARRATTVAQALEALADEPALVLLDWYLPDGPPTEVAAHCRARHIPLVLSTASTQTGDLADELGAVATLEKPFQLDRLFALMDELLGPDAHPA